VATGRLGRGAGIVQLSVPSVGSQVRPGEHYYRQRLVEELFRSSPAAALFQEKILLPTMSRRCIKTELLLTSILRRTEAASFY